MPTRRQPQFRFWGSKQPPAERAAVRAEVTTSDSGDGVATIRLYDPIDSWGGFWGVSASEFATALDELPDGVDEIRLRINSPGGEVWEAVTMMNLLRAHPAKVVAMVDGLAASAASFLAASADELVMGDGTTLMIHDAWDIAVGPASAMRETADVLDKVSNTIAGVYASKGGGTTAEWRSAMVAESWYTPQEAVEAGLADRVVEPPKKAADDNSTDAAQARAKFDLSVFAHRGRDDAPPPPMPAANTLPPAAEPAPEPPSAAAAGSPTDPLPALAALELDLAVAGA